MSQAPWMVFYAERGVVERWAVKNWASPGAYTYSVHEQTVGRPPCRLGKNLSVAEAKRLVDGADLKAACGVAG